MKAIFTFLFAFLFITAPAQKQGIKGQVFWISGNQMPSPGKPNSPDVGVQREIHIYLLARLSDCKSEDGFFTEISSPFITKAVSNADGTFKIRLPAGQYSVFVKEPKGLFANLFDKNGHVNPITVKEKQFAWLTIAIDYQAAY